MDEFRYDATVCITTEEHGEVECFILLDEFSEMDEVVGAQCTWCDKDVTLWVKANKTLEVANAWNNQRMEESERAYERRREMTSEDLW